MKRWVLPLSLLILGTLLAVTAGWGANAVLGSLLALEEGQSVDAVGARRPAVASAEPTTDDAPSAVTAKKSRTLSRKQYVDAILERNIFDHTKVGGTGEPPCVGEDCDNERSDLPVTLLATMVTEPAHLSSALIRDDNSKQSFGYGVGDKVLDATITSISWDKVYVTRGDGTQEYISSADGKDRPDEVASNRTSTTGDEDDQIAKTDDNTYVIDRALVDASLQDLDALSRMARARPHKDSDGNVDGYRLSGVRRNQLLYKLGIRSGDVVHGVNGTPLNSMQAAMGAMSALQNDSSFSFEITRRGQKMTMQYQVR
jgi:type II secretion system protein C